MKHTQQRNILRDAINKRGIYMNELLKESLIAEVVSIMRNLKNERLITFIYKFAKKIERL